MTAAPQLALALVLGSGGVRSAAAIGIVEVLRDAGLEPDLFVGCSSGAIFATALASDMTPALALDAAARLWSAELTRRRRWRGYVELALPRWAGFGPQFALRDARLIEHRLHDAFGTQCIERLPRLQAARSAEARAKAERSGQAIVPIEPRFEPRVALWETAALHRVVEAGRVAALGQLPQLRARLGERIQAGGSRGGSGCSRAIVCTSTNAPWRSP